MSNSLGPHGPQHVRLLSFTISQSLLRFMSIESVMISISSSATPFSSCPQSFLASGFFPMSWLFTSGGQSIVYSASASPVLPMNIQGWFPLGFTGLISLLSKGFSRVFSSTTIGKHHFFSTQPSLGSNKPRTGIWVLLGWWTGEDLGRGSESLEALPGFPIPWFTHLFHLAILEVYSFILNWSCSN